MMPHNHYEARMAARQALGDIDIDEFEARMAARQALNRSPTSSEASTFLRDPEGAAAAARAEMAEAADLEADLSSDVEASDDDEAIDVAQFHSAFDQSAAMIDTAVGKAQVHADDLDRTLNDADGSVMGMDGDRSLLERRSRPAPPRAGASIPPDEPDSFPSDANDLLQRLMRKQELSELGAAGSAARRKITDHLRPQGRAVLGGLKSRPELNGTEVTILSCNEDRRRWGVAFNDGSHISVKPECLLPVPD